MEKNKRKKSTGENLGAEENWKLVDNKQNSSQDLSPRDRKNFPEYHILTVCHVINIKDAINFDLGFPNIDSIPDDLLRGKIPITSEYQYSIRDRETLEQGELIKSKCYRVRLKGISDASRSVGKRVSKSPAIKNLKKKAKSEIISMNLDTGGIFLCKIYEIDPYNRLIVEIFHPVTGLSITEFLITKYSEIYTNFS